MPAPTRLAVARALSAVQVVVLVVVCVLLTVYFGEARTAARRPGDRGVDGQFAEIGFGVALAVTVLGLLLIVLGLVRRTRRGRRFGGQLTTIVMMVYVLGEAKAPSHTLLRALAGVAAGLGVAALALGWTRRNRSEPSPSPQRDPRL